MNGTYENYRRTARRGATALLFVAALAALSLAGCGKARSGGLDVSEGRPATGARRSEGRGNVATLLTKEEVASILGEPVTAVEATGPQSVTYKTDVSQLEAHLELEQKDDVADAVQSMQGARKATGFLGGKPEDVPGLGDEAFFGAMSILYVRKGAASIIITPPNLQQVAGLKAADKVRGAEFGSEEQIKAVQGLEQVEKSDLLAAGLNGGDAMQGALATIKASGKKQGTQYEADARAMAQALAAKVLEKL
jgi:hypothetical protein